MKNRALLILLLFVSGPLLAQPQVKWAQQITGKEWQWISDVVSDSLGNIYAAGDFYDAAIFSPDDKPVKLKPESTNGLFVAKYDPNGQLSWVQQLNGSGGMQAADL